MRYLSFLLAFLLTISFSPALKAQEDTDDKQTAIADQNSEDGEKTRHRVTSDREIVVTATKSEIMKRETGASITIISSDEIEKKGKRSVSDALNEVPGLNVSRSSGFGGLTDVYMRGAASNSVLVLIDGVRVNDPTAPAKGFDFSNLTTENIERIEVIRGSQSTLYGSDALGGVINIITKKGEGDTEFSLKAEGGAHLTFYERLTVNGGSDNAYYSVGASRTDSRGISKAARNRFSYGFLFDNDSYRNTSVSARLGLKFVHDSWFDLTMRYYDSNYEIDDAAFDDDPNHRYASEKLSLRVGYSIPVFKWWDSEASFSYMNQLRRDKDSADLVDGLEYLNMWFKGTMKQGEWKNTFKIKDIDEIIIGTVYDNQQAKTLPYYWGTSMFGPYSMSPYDAVDKSEENIAVYAQNHLKLMDRIFIITGIRYTHPEHFRHNISYSASGSFIIPTTETRLKVSFSTGYKTPSLYQRYAFPYFHMPSMTTYYGNRFLVPEKTKSYDAGFVQPLWGEKILIEANYFSIDYKNLIYYDDFLYQYFNVSAISRGVEAILMLKPVKCLSIAAQYTYNIARYRKIDRQLLRRPKHQGSVTVNFSFLEEKGNLNATVNYVGRRSDFIVYPYMKQMNSYVKLDLAASYWVWEYIQVFARAENITNGDYEEVRGYQMPGVTVYGGFQAKI